MEAVVLRNLRAPFEQKETGRWQDARAMKRPCVLCRGVLSLGKFVLAYATEGAYPILGQVFKSGSRLDAVVGIAYGGVVLVPAHVTYVLFHKWLRIKDPAVPLREDSPSLWHEGGKRDRKGVV